MSEPPQTCPACGQPVLPDAPQGLCPECLMKAGFETGPGKQAREGAPPFIPPSVDQIRLLFPQLEILALLGHGGMGAVYKARQPSLDRVVALKILPPASAEDAGDAERFNREARALARLNHPNIVGVYDFGYAGGMPYFLMEYVEGATLRHWVQAGKLPAREALRIVIQICEALQVAHDEGIVHRDIKPENILLDTKGRVKIADFGIAKVSHQDPQHVALTGERDRVGTAHYMAPEQFENPQAVDHRADIFSLGVVFYELLTGELPLGKFAPPSHKVQVDIRLDEVVLHSLEKEPERRYQQAREVKTDVETIATTPERRVPPMVPPPTMPVTRPPSNASKLWLLLSAFGVAALVFLLGIAFVLFRSRPASAPDPVKVVQANAASPELDQLQQLAMQHIEHQFSSFANTRDCEKWSSQKRFAEERRMLEMLQGSDKAEVYKAICTLAALRSTNALPALRAMAFQHVDKQLRSELSNRRRWMAVWALGVIGDNAAGPEIIHLLYYNQRYVRWCAQISLVRLTGHNFGSDWKAWGAWWNAQNRQPPFDPAPVRWYKGQPEPEKLQAGIGEGDRQFLLAPKKHSLPLESE